MPKRKSIAPEFIETLDFIKEFSIQPTEADYIVSTVWAMGTWFFSPACGARPFTYPYLYLTGGKGSGKSTLGRDVYRYICRNHEAVAQVTGPSLFRMLGTFDEETGEVEPQYPTLAIDEIDATFNGAKDEALRGTLNAGIEEGTTIPRSMGKTSLRFPVYCPKVLMGIDNGNLPDTVTDRAIRIDMKRLPINLTPLYPWKVNERAGELQQRLSDWAKREAMVLREYDPEPPESLTGRRWAICRSLVQIAHAIGNEREVVAALVEIMNRNPEKPDYKVQLFKSIFDLFGDTQSDRVTTKQILQRLRDNAVNVPGGSGKGLSAVLESEGIGPRPIRLPDGHPGITEGKQGEPTYVHRGYMLFQFDKPFMDYVLDDESDDE